MALTAENRTRLKGFFDESRFQELGAVITDLDGTAIHEFQGKYTIPQIVEMGLKKINDLGRPVVINTLRFPLSVIRTFGKEWYAISNAPVPTVLMNGAQLGYMSKSPDDNFYYEEIAAFPLTEAEIDNTLQTIEELLSGGLSDLLVFYYPRNWQKGEIIFTPLKEKILVVKKKYMSASTVFSGDSKMLADELHSQEICMIFLLIEIPQDKLMAYQHTKKANFITHRGVDKQYGAEQIAALLNFELLHSVGAGDSEMDTFLKNVGLSVHVGNHALPFETSAPPIRIAGSAELGELLLELASLQKTSLDKL